MISFKNPDWIREYEYPYEKFEEIPQSLFDEINQNLDKRITADPLVSIVIPVWNEETSVLKTISSLSKLETKFPFEIILVNNNSKDNTQLTLDKLHIKSFFQPKQGTGPARQKGQENALGKYILLGDSDTIYPVKWLERMITELQKPGVVVVYGRYSFIAESGFPRWQLSIVETFKNIIAELRHIKRPWLNTYGLSMAYIKEYGLKIGFIQNTIMWEDGVLTHDLMKYGKVNQVKFNDAIAWTGPRALQRDGTLGQALKKRFIKEIKRFFENFNSRVKTHAPRE